MNTQRGSISIAILLAIILGMAVVGGGAYYIGHQNVVPISQTIYPNITTVQSHTTTTPSTQTPVHTAPKPKSATIPTTQAIEVAGMTKYTDTDFGFSFWYPSGWTVSPQSNTNGMVEIRSGANPPHVLTIKKVTANDMTYKVSAGACGACGPVNYFFDTTQHLWMKQYPAGLNGAPDASAEQIAQSKIALPADVSENTMGGLHTFSTEQKESSVIIPLSAKHFLLVTDITYTDECGSKCTSNTIKGGVTYLANTIVASDPSVATPVNLAQQTVTIQAEATAYSGI